MPFTPTRSICMLSVALVVAGGAPAARAQLADPSAAKAADQCQKAIAKSGATFAAATAKSLGACFGGVFKCVQTKPGDDRRRDDGPQQLHANRLLDRRFTALRHRVRAAVLRRAMTPRFSLRHAVAESRRRGSFLSGRR